jgi:hypothetical protein
MLIELAVAALVIAIGVLALLAVAHVGERAAADSENETRAALFADEVFTTMRLYSDQVSATATNRKVWLKFWRDFVEGTRPLPVANTLIHDETAPELEANDLPCIVGDGEVHTNRWYLGALTSTADDGEPPDFAVQYRILISRPTSDKAVPFLDPEESSHTNTLWATLHVWNGAFRAHPEPFTFYTHFSDAGGLP